jgi:endonuclease/exonuclease/phosphatase family metal-dependent hydrolase
MTGLANGKLAGRRRVTAVVALAALFACVGISPAAVVDLKVMSFNVRTANAADGVNDWDGNRKNLAEQTIRNFGPDLVGIQEDLKRQRDFLADQFPGFEVVGRGAQGGNDGEYVSVMYRKSRFEEVRRGNFWLSETPDVPGSESWGTAFPRMVTWLELRDKQNPGFNFVFMNTHWDHVSSSARVNSATLMRQKIRELASGLPVVVTGDFNADQGGDAYRRMRGLDDFDTVRNLADTYRTIHPGDADTIGTAHGFDGRAGDGRIDWILHDNDFTTVDANIDRTSYSGRYPSDHFPITAVIRPVPEPAGLALAATAGWALGGFRRRTSRGGGHRSC